MRRPFCLLMVAAYIFGYMGFGIHTCLDDGSRHFVWMLGDVSCEHIHHHDAEAGHSCGDAPEHDHQAHDCCSTHVYVLTDAQDTASDCSASDIAESPVFALTAVPGVSPVAQASVETPEGKSPPLKRIPDPSLLSVWRI